MQELDTSDEDVLPGRHRASASEAGRLSVRLGLAALGVLLAVGLGVATADLLGLSDAGQLMAGNPLRAFPPAVQEEPRTERTIDLSARPTHPRPLPPAPPADPSPEPLPAAAVAPGRQSPAPKPPAPPPLRTVRTGDSCTTVGQAAVTTRGDAAVCTASHGKGRHKWRAV